MNKDEIKKEIDISVEVYRQTLEKTYLDNNIPFYGSGHHRLLDFFTGKISMNRLANGNLKISGELPIEMFSHECKGLPNKFSDWAIFPFVCTWFNKNIVESETEVD